MQRTKEQAEYVIADATRIIEEGIVIPKEVSSRIQNMIDEMNSDYKQVVSSDKETREKQYSDAILKREDCFKYSNSINFNLVLSEKLYLFFKKYITLQCEYNRETNIYGLDVVEEFFRTYDSEASPAKVNINKQLVKVEQVDKNVFYTFTISNTLMLKMTYLTSFFTNKGIDERSYFMAQLTSLFTEISNIVEYYTISFEKSHELFENWRNGFSTYDDAEDKLVNEKVKKAKK